MKDASRGCCCATQPRGTTTGFTVSPEAKFTVPRAMTALLGLVSVTVNALVGSAIRSPATWIVIVLEVSPGTNVRTPLLETMSEGRAIWSSPAWLSTRDGDVWASQWLAQRQAAQLRIAWRVVHSAVGRLCVSCRSWG